MFDELTKNLLLPYNPWWVGDTRWQGELPEYRRPIVREVLSDIDQIKQVVSITGPRRVGKSTAVRQVIFDLIVHRGIAPDRVLYFSFDDPAVFASEVQQREIFDRLVNPAVKDRQLRYYFLDEIQRLPNWELFIKKYYDLKYPIRFVISGSASSPIFRKSQESLLGRIQDRHLLPFSFREFCEYRLRDKPAFVQILSHHGSVRPYLLNADGPGVVEWAKRFERDIAEYQGLIHQAVIDYCREGGFPEVWELPDAVRKIEYLMEQQVRKVLYEDLMSLTLYRKPENVLRFFVYLLSCPGIEINITKIASEAGVDKRVIAENLPRLEKTDLILRVPKFSHKPLRVRQGNIKCYPIDMALRNAVLKNWNPPDEASMGVYAENLVIRELMGWREKIEVAYYRDRDQEVDFVLTHGGNKYLPIEVKHRRAHHETPGLDHFVKKFRVKFGVVLTRDMECAMERYLYLPLRYFLLAGCETESDRIVSS
jgi:predicted AAA+ superfamily ATPase